MFNRIKNTALIACLLLLLSPVLHAQKMTLYDQLVSVNKEWINQPDAGQDLKNQPAVLLDERELVRQHLMQTEKLLRNRNTSELTTLQKKNRENNLNTLHSYWQNGAFPINNLYFGRQPVFIDEYNNYCAVGYLMKQSGAEKVAKEIQQTQNYNYLAEIDHPLLMEWVNNSGLDLSELALIQPGYGGEWPATITEMHYNNTGTDINEYIEVHESNGQLSGMSSLKQINFYDYQDVLYKTITVAEMQTFFDVSYFHYYLFPANESFADSGKIILVGNSPTPYDTLSVFTYNSTGVKMKDYYNYSQPFTLQFNTREDESTAVGNSLGFCGRYGQTSWDLIYQLATVGTVNPCINMPVSLSSFDYTIKNKTVELNWQTSSEINNHHFDIEKSTDGIRYFALGHVQAAGNSNTIKNYSFTDTKPDYINHYRLKQVDIDGNFSYSKVLFVKQPGFNVFVVKTNMVQNNLQVQINSEHADAGSIVIYDFSGKQVLRQKAIQGNSNINITHLACGKYLARLYTAEGKVYSQQFVKGL